MRILTGPFSGPFCCMSRLGRSLGGGSPPRLLPPAVLPSLALLIALLAAACPGSKTHRCGDYICQSGLVCDEIHEVCVLPVQLDLCVGLDDGEPCQAPGSPGDYVCDQQVCMLSSCGDGILDSNTGEQCEDGNKSNGDGCSSICQVESGWICSNDIPCLCTRCGDGQALLTEVCDGQDLRQETCKSQGFDGGDLACLDTCDGFDASSCYACGDGVCAAQETEAGCPQDCGPFAVTTGAFHSCVVKGNGTVFCWGNNDYGQLGDGTNTDSSTPVKVLGITNAATVSAGTGHTCAVKTDGTAACWGNNFNGRLGDGTQINRPTPVQVSGLAGVAAIDAGLFHTCAVTLDGRAFCWGSNEYGQLGNDSTLESSTPVQVSGLVAAVSISTGGRHTCAVRADGGASYSFCWGYNYHGQLGDGSHEDRLTPVQVLNLTDAVTVSAGAYHTCALTADGTAACWGDNYQGQLGDGSNDASSVPVQVTGLAELLSISSRYYHSCVVEPDGSAACWGDDSEGQLGDGLYKNSNTPVEVQDLGDVAAVSTGSTHTCALTTGGEALCWGDNNSGQLGDGTTDDSLTPVQVLMP